MNFLQKAILLGVSSVACVLATAPKATAFMLGLEVDETPYKVSFSKQTFDSNLITFPDLESAFIAAEAIAAAVNNDIQEFSKEEGYRKGINDIYVPYSIGGKKIFTVRIREYKDGTAKAFYGNRRLKPEGEAVYANFEHAPEPLTVLGSIAAIGMGVAIKRQRQST